MPATAGKLSNGQAFKAGTQESRNRGNGSSEIEGKAARAGGERAGTRTSFKGIAEIEGKAARVVATELGQRRSFKSGIAGK
jgi:hypothetical protein